MSSPVSARIAALDSLRGIAALGILALHAFPARAFWMWSFVDLFFVLSGYLISDILLRLDLADLVQLRNFWMRRVLRIWPVYFLALAAAIAIAAAHAVLGDAGPGYKWGRCFVFLQFVEGYWGAGLGGYPGWFRHSWTLAAEEQFYVLWPLVLLLLAKRPWAVLAVALGLLATAMAMRAGGYPLILMLTRSDGLALGAALAVLRGGAARPWLGAPTRATLYVAAGALGGALVVPYLVEGYRAGAVRMYGDLATFGNWSINVTGFALIYCALVGALLDGRLRALARLLQWRPLVHVGLLSYAIYMFQGPVRGALHLLAPRADWIDYAAIPVTILLAWVSRRTVEGWCERRKGRFPLKLQPRAAVTGQDAAPATVAAPAGTPPP